MKFSILYTLVSFIFTIDVNAQELYSKYAFKINPDNYKYSNQSLPSETSLKLSDIQNIFKQSENYENFLQILNVQAPQIFEEPVLVHSSGSIQKSTFKRPRTILHDSGIMLAFSEPENSTTRHIEILSYNTQLASFSATELVFEGDQKKINSNPQSCNVCHGESLRPIWLPYDIWPQNYGSFAGLFSSGREKEEFIKFLQTSNQVGVYKFLKKITREDGSQLKGGDHFTLLTRGLAQHSLHKELSNHLNIIKPFKYALIAAAKGCSNAQYYQNGDLITHSLPEELNLETTYNWAEIQKTTIENRQNKTKHLLQFYKRIFQTDMSKLVDAEPRLDEETFPISETRYILENMGFAYKSLQMSNGMFQYAMSSPSNIALDASTQIVELFPDVFLELKPNIQSNYGLNWAMWDCGSLKTASLNELTKNNITTWPQLNDKRRVSTFGLCVGCHTADSKSPFIPFDTNEGLKKWLRTELNYKKIIETIDSGRMPKNYLLTSAERQNLKNVLTMIMDDDSKLK